MTIDRLIPLGLGTREEAWLWWFSVVALVVVVFLLLGIVRRRLVRPMPHTPTDTTDAWAEAGRRLRAPGASDETPGDDGETP